MATSNQDEPAVPGNYAARTPEPAAAAGPAPKRGVYCLANDRVLEWFQMFVRSFRHFNPDLPLTVIPYDCVIDQLAQLAPQYNFRVLSEAAAAEFDPLEGIIKKIHKNKHIFRKWGTFFGEYDEFLYVDADVAVTGSLERIFAAFGKSEADFVYFDTDINEVYLPQFVEAMRAKYNSPGFNAGVYLSRKGVVTREQLWQKAEEGAGALHMFIPRLGDQPFLNWVMDTLQRRMVRIHNLCPGYAATIWAQSSEFHVRWRGWLGFFTPQNPFTYFNSRRGWWLGIFARKSPLIYTLNHWQGCVLKLPIPFVHWAGCGFPTMVQPEVFLHYRLLGVSPEEQIRYRQEFFELRRQQGRMDPPPKQGLARWLDNFKAHFQA